MISTDMQPPPLDAMDWYIWELDEPESNWLLTYVDMLSVLLAMLVVLLGHMAVQQLRNAPPDPVIEPIANLVAPALKPPREIAPVEIELPRAQPRIPSPESRLEAAIASDFQGAVKLVQRDHGISLEIADVILFESSRAALRLEAWEVLARLALTLQSIGDAEIAVEGHTDDRPIKGGRFRSNWELAAARANAVTRFLLEQGFAPVRLRSVSYGDTRPVADNHTAEGRAENRRVSLRVDFL